MGFDRFELPPSLKEWIESGRHPEELLGDRWRVCLLDDLISLDWLTPDERAQRAAFEWWWAEVLASGQETSDTVLYRTLEDRQLAAHSSRWTHDLLSDPGAAHALLSLLDPVEAASVEIEADRLKRPALLETHTSLGERCASCGEVVACGTKMLTFDARHERFDDDETPMSETATALRETSAGQELYADEEHRYTAWHWCTACVLATVC